MTPFIMRYSRKCRGNDALELPQKYDVVNEVIIFNDDEDYIQHKHKNIILASGSTMTKASTDPTNDESTDR